MTEPAHAVYAPSGAHRWIECTASAEALSKLPNFDHLYGDGENKTGTEAHEEIERCLSPGLDAAGRRTYFYPIPVNPKHPAAYGIALLLDYVRQLPPGRFWIEQRVKLTEQIWGRPDVAHYEESTATLTVIDYKNGFIGVDPNSPQLRIYAAAVILTYQLPAKWVRYAVVQPNDFRPVPRVKQWAEPATDLYAWANEVAKIPNEPKTFKTGEHCRYCPLFGTCPASRDVLTNLATMMASPPDRILAHQVATFAACKKPIDDWFKSFEKFALRDALLKGAPPGMKIVATQKHRAWTDIDLARAFVLDQRGVNALDPPTPAQAEKLGLDISALSERPDGGPVLAFASDSRPPWEPKSVEKMFGEILKK